MGKSTWSQTAVLGGDALFRAWGKAVSDGIAAAAGTALVRTADGGQVNWATTTVNESYHFEIYAFTDSAQATQPYFLKLEYMVALGTTQSGGGFYYPSVTVTLGTAVLNSGGNMSNAVSFPPLAEYNNVATSQVYATAFPSYACAQPGYFGLLLRAGAENDSASAFGKCGGWITIERMRDDSGAILTEGLVVQGPGYTSIPGMLTDAGSTCWVPGNRTTSLYGSEVQLFRHYANPAGRVRNLVGSATHMKTEIPAGAVIPVTLLAGVSHNYLCTSQWTSGLSAVSMNLVANQAGPAGSHCLAMRYED